MFISLTGGLCSLLALTQWHLHFGLVSKSQGGHVMGLQLLLENTLWAVLGAQGRCIAVGLPLLSQNSNCSVRLGLRLWITCYWTLSEEGAESALCDERSSALLLEAGVGHNVQWPWWPGAGHCGRDDTLLPSAHSRPSHHPCCPHHHYPGDGKRGFSPRFH